METYLWIGAGGFAGAVVRYGMGNFIAQRADMQFPLGTFVINVGGSLLLGFFVAMGTEALPTNLRLALTVGFLGAYTTFSTWSVETLRLVEGGNYSLAVLNILGSTVVGLGAAWIGIVLGRWLNT